ncbi:hypothetical protein LOTGIDRAFT_207352 [Lottia gigantea]|uniref:Uncharacterized protein n=1 Tax=Lottia gigantea TaxID=225164 RepID=V3ZRF0_LOTGI|nr:hypothetical protein LOTGIDRAFT_207352 [Lottia gigantea]ESO83451.1 hypothetical protein LOTGIDRAFT_207352 [Lottia gigantea]
MSAMNFLDLPWEHVICKKILRCLRIGNLFRLRAVCKDFRDLVQLYFDTGFYLNLLPCSGHMTSAAFVIITRNCYCIKRMNLSNGRNWLQNDNLIPVLRNNNQLIVINLTGCSSLTNISLQAIASNCPGLQTLILRDCYWINNEGILSVCLNCKEIVHLDLTGCWNIGDSTINSCLMRLKFLEVLSLAKIYGVTNNTIMAIATTCKNIRHLNIHGCWRVTNEAIWLLGEYCLALRMLQVKDCRDITEASLSRLRAKKIRIDVPPPAGCPNLAILAGRSLHIQT